MRAWLHRFLSRRTCADLGHHWVEVERYASGPRHPTCYRSGPVAFVCDVQDCTGKVACVRCKAVAVMDYTRPVV